MKMFCKSCATVKSGCYHTTDIGSMCYDCYREQESIKTMLVEGDKN